MISTFVHFSPSNDEYFSNCQILSNIVKYCFIASRKPWNRREKLQIWDTAGQERFRSITQRYAPFKIKLPHSQSDQIIFNNNLLFCCSYYRSAHALILVYDISCQPTFDCLPDWLREIQEYANSKVLKILVGNKTDRDDREIPTAIGEEFAKQQGMYFLETSAKEADNVERLFYEIAAELIEQARTKEVHFRWHIK